MSNQEIDLLSSFEQLETTLYNTGAILATYYHSLVRAGIPEKLAHDLVLDWHNIYWSTINTGVLAQNMKK